MRPKDLPAQIELSIDYDRQPDRNLTQGGRSFYFFDFDDNVMFLGTSIFLCDRGSGEELALGTGTYTEIQHLVGQPGPWERYEIVPGDDASFRRFRDHEGPGPQPFVEDLRLALDAHPADWQGPSWRFFAYAVANERPIAIITARGHHPQTIEAGLSLLREHEHLSVPPNLLGIYPVTYPPLLDRLSSSETTSVPELKRAAIIDAVEVAMATYGANPHHRFGMSDDDPHNIALIVGAMTELKGRYPYNSFFVIDASQTPLVKSEVFADTVTTEPVSEEQQLELFR